MSQYEKSPIVMRTESCKEKEHSPSNVRVLYSRVQSLLYRRQRKQQKRVIEISAPFNMTREPISIPGITEDEIDMLREKAAASRLGVAELMPRSTSGLTSHPPMGPPRIMVQRATSSPPLLF